MSQTALKPEQFSHWLASQGVGSPATHLNQLRQQSSTSPVTPVEPLAIPGGEAGEHAVQDQDRAYRQHLKLLLAAAKLQTGLIVAALSKPTATMNESAEDGVSAYVSQACRWIDKTTEALAEHWRGEQATTHPNFSGERTLSEYHRYEIARMLVAALEHQPKMVDTIEPSQMAEWLAQSPPSVFNEPPASQPWHSAGADNDLKMAWSRALMRVMDAAIQAPFNRELPVLLNDARQAIALETERQVQQFTLGQDLPAEALRIVQLHALNTASTLYAATLVQVHHESARMIQTYQDLNNQGKEAEADQCALDYQTRKLGYAGVAHHFHNQVTLHGRMLAKTSSTSIAPVAAEPRTPTAGSAGLVVGSLVIAKAATHVCAEGERGVCFSQYHIGMRPGWGILFESGNIERVNADDAAVLLKATGEICLAVTDYQYQSAAQLLEDFNQGRFKAAFPLMSTPPLQQPHGSNTISP